MLTTPDRAGAHGRDRRGANGGTIAGTPLTIEPTGPAVSAATFTYTAPVSGSFSNTITAATSSGTSYTSATATASR